MLKADDPLLTINFVRLVENRPCIWNQSLPEYSKRTVIEKAWAEVAHEVGDSPSNCRERWRHIRGAYLRSVKNLASNTSSTKKKYYLDEYLQFLLPHTKTRNSHWNFVDCYKKLKTECDDDYIDCQELVTVASPENDYGPASSSSRDMDESFVLPKDTSNDRKRKFCLELPPSTDDDFVDWSNNKKERIPITEDPNMLFLRSLLPDMLKMSDKQNRRFRQKVIGLMDEILEDADVDTNTKYIVGPDK